MYTVTYRVLKYTHLLACVASGIVFARVRVLAASLAWSERQRCKKIPISKFQNVYSPFSKLKKKHTIALNLPSIKVQWAAPVKRKQLLNFMFKLLCEWDIILCKTLDGGLFCGTLALLAVRWFKVSVSGGSSNDIGAVTENKKQSTNNWTTGHSPYEDSTVWKYYRVNCARVDGRKWRYMLHAHDSRKQKIVPSKSVFKRHL